MSSQIFKNNVPTKMLFDLLDSICLKNEKHYLFNSDSYKKGVYKEVIQQFITDCTPYYHLSKRKYLEKKLTFNTFANTNESVSLTVISKNGATAYYANVISIDGTTITPVWSGGVAPSAGTSSGYDMYNFNILKTAANTYVVFGAVGSYK